MDTSNPTPRHEDLVYDVGMHRGEDTDYYLQKGFRVVGFEADPDLARVCRTRFADAIDRRMLVIVEGAIVDHDSLNRREKTTTFFRNLDVSVWGTVSRDWAARNQMLGTRTEPLDVGVVDFGECLRLHGIPYYLKIDIEGSDMACLKALLEFERKPAFLSVESEKVQFSRLVGEIDLLEKLGYHEFRAVQQGSVQRQRAPAHSSERRSVPFQFQAGSSGLFGNDLPGRWKGRHEILAEYRGIFVLYRLIGDRSILGRSRIGRRLLHVVGTMLGRPWIPGWYDTHARHESSA